jgi:hypothetical protein
MQIRHPVRAVVAAGAALAPASWVAAVPPVAADVDPPLAPATHAQATTAASSAAAGGGCPASDWSSRR